jgi:hypothetical protein
MNQFNLLSNEENSKILKLVQSMFEELSVYKQVNKEMLGNDP